jgi:hypothetical protein
MTSAAPVSASRAGAAAGSVVSAIGRAAARSGVDFSYLLANARAESGLDPAARARTSSATGLFQFTDATWLQMVRRHGADHGLGWAAAALNGAAGSVTRAVKDQILALRHDADAAAGMAAAFTRDNAAALERGLGRVAGATDLYLAAFFGAGGAINFLKSLAANPDIAAARLLPAAAAANRSTFFAGDGRARSLAEVHAIVAGRISRAGAGAAPVPAPAPDPEQSDAMLAANTARARMAYMMLAALQ